MQGNKICSHLELINYSNNIIVDLFVRLLWLVQNNGCYVFMGSLILDLAY